MKNSVIYLLKIAPVLVLVLYAWDTVYYCREILNNHLTVMECPSNASCEPGLPMTLFERLIIFGVESFSTVFPLFIMSVLLLSLLMKLNHTLRKKMIKFPRLLNIFVCLGVMYVTLCILSISIYVLETQFDTPFIRIFYKNSIFCK